MIYKKINIYQLFQNLNNKIIEFIKIIKNKMIFIKLNLL